MALFSGKDGKLFVDSTELADITRWRFKTVAKNVAYASSATGGFRRRLKGVKDGSGSLQFKLNATDPLTEQFDEGDQITLKLYVDATHFFTVPAVIDAIETVTEIEDGNVVGGTVEFSTDGAWTEPNFGS